MAEGPLVHYYAKRLRKVLKGREVRVKFGIRKLKQLEPSLKGLRIQDVEAHGKQFRIQFPDDRVLLVHLMMWGSWRIYRKGVAFSTPIVRLFTNSELEGDPKWGNPGPDPLRPDFSLKQFFHLLGEQPAREIGEALLDQWVISGIGNILRIEILFQSRIHPRRLVKSLSEDERHEMLRWILKLPRTWMKTMGKKSDWISIYRKSGKPCPRCRSIIEFFRQGGRITYICPECQQLIREHKKKFTLRG